MPHAIAPGFVTEHEIHQIACNLNINRFPADQIIRCALFTMTVGDLRRLCTTAMIGARLIEGSADFAFAYGFTAPQRSTADTE